MPLHAFFLKNEHSLSPPRIKVVGLYYQRVAWKIPNKIAELPPVGTVVNYSTRVTVNSEGKVEDCVVVDGKDRVALGEPSPCLRFPTGLLLQRATDKLGNPTRYVMLMKQSVEFEPR